MKNLTIMKRFIMCASILIVNATPVWAAATGREDNSDLFIWIFLGFCALIVVAQLVPATMVLFGLAKGVKKERVEAEIYGQVGDPL
jgi:hypothetical protein